MNTSPTIVIAEDDADDLSFILDALERRHFGGAVRNVDNGLKLMQLLRGERAGLADTCILLDLNMPLKDGYEALAEIRQDPELQNVPVAILTSSTSPEEERRCMALGARRYYRKPLTIEEYDEVAESIIGFVGSGG